jgi:phosphoserine phosphatase RsbU/P
MLRGIHAATTPEAALKLYVDAMTLADTPACYVELACEGLPRGKYRVTRFRRHDLREVLADNSPFKWEGLPVHEGGVFGSIVAGAARAFVDLEVRVNADDPFGADLAEYTALAAAPILTAGSPEWAVLLHSRKQYFEGFKLDEFLLNCNLMGAIVDSLAVRRSLAEAQALVQAEIERVADIQKSLLPAGKPHVPTLDVAHRVVSYDRAGGDLIDFEATPKGNWGFILADASGHGLAAAVVAAMLTAIVRAFPSVVQPGPESVCEALTFANAHLCEKRIERSFVTAVLGVYVPARRELHFSRAGHPLPMLKRKGRPWEELKEAGGLPMGIMDGTRYESAKIGLGVGDVLLLYSDGIIEAGDGTGEQFGTERLGAALTAAVDRDGVGGEGGGGGGADAQSILEEIEAAVLMFSRGTAAGDDRTLLVLRGVA